MTKKRPSLIGVILGFLAAPIAAYTVGQLLTLAFVDPLPDTPWEDERRELVREWFWVVSLSPLLAIPIGVIATPALLLLHHLRRTGLLAHVAAGAVTGLLFWSWLASSKVEAAGMPRWVESAAMGASGAFAYWMFAGFPGWFMRLTDEGPPGETWRERLARATRGQG